MNFNKFRTALFYTFQYRNAGKGFSLLEVLVAITVFGLIIAAAAGTFSSIQQAWRAQRNTIDIVQNSRWAMEFMVNELRQAGASSMFIPVLAPPWTGTRIRFQNPSGALVWFWRGNTASDTTGIGNSAFLYRGIGATIGAAYATRQQLANFVVPNASNNLFFNIGGGLYVIELTVRPQPTQAVGRENRNYTLRTQVRPRN